MQAMTFHEAYLTRRYEKMLTELRHMAKEWREVQQVLHAARVVRTARPTSPRTTARAGTAALGRSGQ